MKARKVLALALALAMCLGLVTMTAQAAENTPTAGWTVTEVVPYKYYDASDFSEGLAAVSLGEVFDHKWGFIDKTGAEVVPCKYDRVGSFSEGLAVVGLNGKRGFIDKTGAEVVPRKYDYASDFSEGLARVERNGKCGFIDKTDTEVVPCKYDYTSDFSEGLAVVRLNGKWGFIDKTGAEVVPGKYDYPSGFSEGLARVVLDDGWGFIDKTGTEVVLRKYDKVESFSEGLAVVELGRDADYTGKYGFIDKTGAEVIPCKYDDVGSFSEGLAMVNVGRKNLIAIGIIEDGKCGFIDKTGAEVVPLKYDDAKSFSEGLAAVRLDGKWGFISIIRNNNSPEPTESEPPVEPSVPPVTPASELFGDVVKGSWYEPGVTYVVSQGLFKGMAEGVFSPDTNMTRAMVMTVLARVDGQDTTNAINGPWYTNIMNWAVAKGISDGTMPDSSVTREQLVTLLYRYAKPAAMTGDLTAFADGSSVSAYAENAMVWAVKQGIITGKNGGRLDPQGFATRAEVAIIFQRFVEKTQLNSNEGK